MMKIHNGWLKIEENFREILDGSKIAKDDITMFGFLTLNDYR